MAKTAKKLSHRQQVVKWVEDGKTDAQIDKLIADMQKARDAAQAAKDEGKKKIDKWVAAMDKATGKTPTKKKATGTGGAPKGPKTKTIIADLLSQGVKKGDIVGAVQGSLKAGGLNERSEESIKKALAKM